MTVVAPQSTLQGVKVRDSIPPSGLNRQRVSGQDVATIVVDVHLEAKARRLAEWAAEILADAGWDTEIGPDGCHVYVREPNWRDFLPPDSPDQQSTETPS
uniref:hypothetical protein n=1 Tax=Nonomuraea sp. CA-251285 TaxID=3240002 RepID=UPI003F499549